MRIVDPASLTSAYPFGPQNHRLCLIVDAMFLLPKIGGLIDLMNEYFILKLLSKT